ncbi:hypothetical protein P4K07_004211 [Salmonella enterica]|nr:hypothetical protein [Salmonella enterica]
MFDFGFDAFMIYLHDNEPFWFGFVTGCALLAPFLLFPFFKNFIGRDY